MGQKSNLLTLRKNHENLNTSFNAKQMWETASFINVLKKCFDKKGVIITSHTTSISNGHTNVSLDVFFKTQKIAKYKKKVKSIQQVKRKLALQQNKGRRNFLKKTYKGKKKAILKKRKNYKAVVKVLKTMLKSNLVSLKMHLVNKHEILGLKLLIYKELKKFKKPLFSRRFNLFYDFIKLTSLFATKKINIETYCNIIGTIFRFLPKRSHSKFFTFIKTVLNVVINLPRSKVKGIKLLLNGKIKGKLRSNSFKLSVGAIGLQTLCSKNDLSKMHINTLYGCFGLSLWANYIKTQKEIEKDNSKNKKLKKKAWKQNKNLSLPQTKILLKKLNTKLFSSINQKKNNKKVDLSNQKVPVRAKKINKTNKAAKAKVINKITALKRKLNEINEKNNNVKSLISKKSPSTKRNSVIKIKKSKKFIGTKNLAIKKLILQYKTDITITKSKKKKVANKSNIKKAKIEKVQKESNLIIDNKKGQSILNDKKTTVTIKTPTKILEQKQEKEDKIVKKASSPKTKDEIGTKKNVNQKPKVSKKKK